jgi:hypothetical protein
MPLIVGEFIPHDSSLQFKTLNHLHADVLKAPFALPESASKRTTHQIARSSHFDPSGHFRGELASRKRTFTQSGATEACDQSPSASPAGPRSTSVMIHPALPERETAPPAPTAQRSLSSSRKAPQTVSSSPRTPKPILSPTCACSTPMLLEPTGRRPVTRCHRRFSIPHSWCTTRLGASTLDDARHLILK